MTFEFATAGRILFGRGTSQRIPTLARDLGRRALVVLGGSGRAGCFISWPYSVSKIELSMTMPLP